MKASICEHCDLMIVLSESTWVHRDSGLELCWAPSARPNGAYWEAD